MKLFFVLALSLFSTAQARTLDCEGRIYNMPSRLSTTRPSILVTPGDLYAAINWNSERDGGTVLMELQKLDEVETATSLETKYAWCTEEAKAAVTAMKRGSASLCRAIRILKVDKQTGNAEFFNGVGGAGTDVLVSQHLVCKIN